MLHYLLKIEEGLIGILFDKIGHVLRQSQSPQPPLSQLIIPCQLRAIVQLVMTFLRKVPVGMYQLFQFFDG